MKRKFGVEEVQAASWVWGNSLQEIIFHFPREKFFIKTKHGKTLSISNFCSDGRFNKLFFFSQRVFKVWDFILHFQKDFQDAYQPCSLFLFARKIQKIDTV